MSSSENNDNQPKKISLEEAIRKKLASKKEGQSINNAKKKPLNTNQKLQSQQTKKINNQRKRMGV